MSATTSSFREAYLKARYRFSLSQVVAELLQKRWMDALVPFVVMVVVLVTFTQLIPGYTYGRQPDQHRPGIRRVRIPRASRSPWWSSAGASTCPSARSSRCATSSPSSAFVHFKLAAGGGHPHHRAVTGGRARGGQRRPHRLPPHPRVPHDAGDDDHLPRRVRHPRAEVQRRADGRHAGLAAWEWLGSGSLLGVPSNIIALAVVGIAGHIFLSRSRPGWHLTAIGAGRRAARHAGIGIEKNLFWTYVGSGVLCSIGGLFYAARLASAGSDTGLNSEIVAITAVVLGGVSLGGGKGSVGRALIGATTVLVLTNGVVRLGVVGGMSSVVLGATLLLAVAIDVHWAKHRHKAIAKLYVVPTYLALPPGQSTDDGPFKPNQRLAKSRGHRPRRGRRTRGLHHRPPGAPLRRRASGLDPSLLRAQLRDPRGLLASPVAARWAWPSTRTTTSSSASPAWGCTASARTARSSS